MIKAEVVRGFPQAHQNWAKFNRRCTQYTLFPSRTLKKTLVNMENWSLDNSSQVKSSPRQIHFTCRRASLDATISLVSVFIINSVPEDSYEAGVGTLSHLWMTKLRGLFGHWIIGLRFKNISVALNYELKETSGNKIVWSFPWAHTGSWGWGPPAKCSDIRGLSKT